MAVIPKRIEVVTAGVTINETCLRLLSQIASHRLAAAQYQPVDDDNPLLTVNASFSTKFIVDCAIEPDKPSPALDRRTPIDRILAMNARTGHLLLEATAARTPHRPSIPKETVFGFVVHPKIDKEQSTVLFSGDKATINEPTIRQGFDSILFSHLAKMSPVK